MERVEDDSGGDDEARRGAQGDCAVSVQLGAEREARGRLDSFGSEREVAGEQERAGLFRELLFDRGLPEPRVVGAVVVVARPSFAREGFRELPVLGLGRGRREVEQPQRAPQLRRGLKNWKKMQTEASALSH